jgi:protein-S-isoprenylcysteine O-methyltransferase Ste14
MPVGGFWHWLAVISLTLCWGLFVLAWVTGAVYNASRAPAVRQRGESVPLWLAVLVVAVVLGRLVPAWIWEPITVVTPWLVSAGVAVLAVSTAFTLGARVALGTMWTSTAVVKQDHELRTQGPYGITRHPIYTGLLGMLGGTAMIEGLGRWVAYFLVSVLVIGLKIRAEERLLDRALGGAYQRYRQRVPQLIPGLRGLRR